MYCHPREVIPALRSACSDFLSDLGESPDPMAKRDLSLAMWVLAWDLEDWDSLPYDWRCNLFYFGQVVAAARTSPLKPRGEAMAYFCKQYIETLWEMKTRFYIGKRVFCSPREMYWKALWFLPGHDYIDAMWTLLEGAEQVDGLS